MLEETIIQQASALLARRSAAEGDPIEKLLHTPIPAELWHYTSVLGLEGVLKSGKVWATEAHFTTDNTEFVHARDVALDFLRNLAPETEEDKLAKQLAIDMVREEFASGTLSQSGTEVFVVSFSSAENLKSQWAEYADQSRGVSIAFDLRRVRPPWDALMAITVAPCIYDPAEKEALIAAALRNLMSVASSLHKNTGDWRWLGGQLLVNKLFNLDCSIDGQKASIKSEISAQLRAASAITRFDLLRLASHCKNPYYAEEREWRLALPHTKSKPLKHVVIEHRGLNNQIPYIAHNLFSEGKLPIVRILTGPLCDELTVVENMLDSYGYDVPVAKATSPLRRPDQIR